MSGRTPIAATGVLALSLALSLGVAGCGAEAPKKAVPTSAAATGTPTPTPTPSPSAEETSPAATALEALQASLAELEVVKTAGRTSGSPDAGRTSGTSNLKSGDFATTVSIGAGKDLQMMRHGDLTWTKAPPSYWVGVGYTKQSAAQARGKWVVGALEAVRSMIAVLDPGTVIRALLDRGPADVTSVARVTSGPMRGNRVLVFRQANAVQKVYLTNGAKPKLLRVDSTAKGRTTTVDFLAAPRTFTVRVPAASDVLQAS